MTHIVLGIGLGLTCLSAVIAGGTFAGNSLSALLESTELASPNAINPLR
jgi:F0F1-type ATP synthase membrane subunit c/vacuolar-type H+-ATPase subunit K